MHVCRDEFTELTPTIRGPHHYILVLPPLQLASDGHAYSVKGDLLFSIVGLDDVFIPTMDSSQPTDGSIPFDIPYAYGMLFRDHTSDK
jgi:hypothetical protein